MKKAKKWSKCIVSFALAALLCFGLIPFGQFGGILAAGDETIPQFVNGDFEGETLSSWTVSDSNLIKIASEDEWATKNPTKTLNIYSAEAVDNLSIKQTITGVPAGTYQVCFDYEGAGEDVGTHALVVCVNNGSPESIPATAGYNDWKTMTTQSFTLEAEGSVTVEIKGSVSAGYWGHLDNFILKKVGGGEGSESEEGYSVQVTPSSSDVLEGTKVSLTATVKKDGELVTDLEAAGLCLYWYADTWLTGHDNGRTDVTLDNDNNSGHTLSADVTPNSAGTYYIAAELKDGDTRLKIVTATITSTVDNSTAVEADIFVKKVSGLSEDFIRGMDISSYIAEKDSGVKFYDFDGNELNDQGFFNFLHDICDVNYVRIRVWNDPYYVAEDGSIHGYGGGNNDLEKAIRMGEWATNAGMKVLIDFHYSDFWADPGKQQAPKAWENLSVEEKAVKVSEFTTNSLNTLLDEGVDVGMVQVGNETNGAVAGVKGLDGMCVLFKAGCEAVDAVEEARGKEILTALHFTNPETAGRYANYAKALNDNNVPYDIFASSYYPEWHGSLDNLTSVLGNVAKSYGKMVMVAETNYPFTDEAGDEPGLIDKSGTFDYNISVQGQADELRAVINAVNSIGEKGIGVFWWESAWIPVSRCDSTVDEKTANERWENNKKIWETYGSGWASSWGGYYDETGDAAQWYGGSAADHKSLFDFDGHPMASILTFKYVYTGATSTVRMDAIRELDKISVISGEEIPWPATVTICYNDGTTDEKEVVWNAEQKAKVDGVGSYVVDGTVTIDGQTFDISVEIEILPCNLLVNGGFEEGDTSWTVDGNGANITNGESGNAHSGSWHLHFWADAAFEYHVYQTVTGLEPGLYALSAYVEGGGAGESDEYILYAEADGKNYTAAATLKGYQNFDHPTIENIEVGADGKITVGVKVKASASAWGGWDDFYLYLVDEEGQPDEPSSEEPGSEPDEPSSEEPSGQPGEPSSEEPSGQPGEPSSEEPSGQPNEPSSEEPSGQPGEPSSQEPSGQPSEPSSEGPSEQPGGPSSEQWTTNVKIEEAKGDGKVKTTLKDSLEYIINALLTSEEREAAKTQSVSIYLEVENKSEQIKPEDKKLVEEKLQTEKMEGFKVGAYLDLTLFKQIGSNAPKDIPNPMAEITISIDIPTELVNNDPAVKREYSIVRIHDGVAEILPTTVENGTIIFKSDKFSIYAIAYKDTIVQEQKAPDQTGETSQQAAPSANTSTASGNTSDVPIAIYIILLVVAAALIATVVVVRRKNNNK